MISPCAMRFIWSSIEGMKGWILLLTVLTVGTGVMEAVLFQVYGNACGLVRDIYA